MASLLHYAGQPVHSRTDAENLNAAAGFHFFDAGALSFFSSRIGDSFYPCEARKCSYFVTSERDKYMPKKPRAYTVRAISWETGRVRTIGAFLKFQKARAAHTIAKGYAEGKPESETTEEG